MNVELESGDSNSSLTSDELEKNGISHYYPPLELKIKNLELKTKN